MVKKLSVFIAVLMSISAVDAQKKPITNPALDFAYFVQGEGGANGLTVTYNPNNGYYYCVQAGNADFPLEVFTGSGEVIYTTTPKVDTRGFWYNAKLKCFEGTKFTGGTFKMFIDANGYPSNPISQANSSNFIPPNDQSQIVCNIAKGEMYAYDYGKIYTYNQKNNKLKKVMPIKNLPVDISYINPYALLYTGYKNYEFIIYDIVNYQLLFINAKGIYQSSVKMPLDAPPIEVFRLGFGNDRIFLYDGDYRAWYAYKIFMDASGN
jgi:hypothetical protein